MLFYILSVECVSASSVDSLVKCFLFFGVSVVRRVHMAKMPRMEMINLINLVSSEDEDDKPAKKVAKIECDDEVVPIWRRVSGGKGSARGNSVTDLCLAWGDILVTGKGTSSSRTTPLKV